MNYKMLKVIKELFMVNTLISLNNYQLSFSRQRINFPVQFSQTGFHPLVTV